MDTLIAVGQCPEGCGYVRIAMLTSNKSQTMNNVAFISLFMYQRSERISMRVYNEDSDPIATG